MSRVGLVATFRFVPLEPREGGQEASDTFERCWSTLESFLLFHLSKGVEHIFLYADDDRGSNDVYIEKVAETFNKSQVSVDIRNESQREHQQANCRLWSQLGSFSATEVPARQSLNAEDALRRAGEMQLDWLLHLDIDELFFTSEPNVRPHFERLNKLGVEQMTYANHEAVPLREDVGDYFREVSTFKVNHLLLPLSHEVGERSRFWRRRTRHGQYMLAYDNGKSAVRVLPCRIVPQSVHRWRTLKSGETEKESALDPPRQASGGDVTGAVLPSVQQEGREGLASISSGTGKQSVAAAGGGSAGNGNDNNDNDKELSEGGVQTPARREGGSAELVNRVAMADPRELRFDEVLECRDPCVLHYPSCGLSWLQDKYRLLGSFPSSWFDGKLPIAPCFHLDARNAIHGLEGAPVSPKDEDGVSERVEEGVGGGRGRVLYRKEVMLCPDEHSEEMQAQLEHGVLRVIDEPARVIQQALDARAPPGSKITPEMLSSTGEGARVADGVSASDDKPGTKLEEAVGRNPTDSPSMMMAAALRVAGTLPETTAGLTAPLAEGGDNGGDARPAEDPGAGVDNAWILAACAREFL